MDYSKSNSRKLILLRSILVWQKQLWIMKETFVLISGRT
nr:MAG TPA: hypothetical protein [Caudoviricetes sp.]